MNHELVTITCPHCYGTGHLETYNLSGAKQAKQVNHCVFCDGAGQLTVEIEHEEV